MLPKMLLLFIGLPLIEMAILIKLGEVFGFWPTIWLVVITGFLGASLAKQQGFSALTRIQQEMQNGRLPASEMTDGLLILIGGIVLLTPGLLTDIAGFALLVPQFRQLIKSWLASAFKAKMQQDNNNHIYIEKD